MVRVELEACKAQIEEAQRQIQRSEKLYKEAMQDIEEVKTERVKAEMAKASLESFLTGKDSEVVNSTSFITHLQDERESLR